MEPLTIEQKTRFKFILAAGLFFLAWVLHPLSVEDLTKSVQEVPGSAIGYMAGQVDIFRGKIVIEAYGLRSERSDKLLEDRYGIKVRSMGCVVSYFNRGYESGYRKAVTNAFQRKFGRDVFEECYRDSKKAENDSPPNLRRSAGN